jgi:hypothetical protein
MFLTVMLYVMDFTFPRLCIFPEFALYISILDYENLPSYTLEVMEASYLLPQETSRTWRQIYKAMQVNPWQLSVEAIGSMLAW